MLQRWLISDNPPPQPDCFIVPSYAVKDSETPTAMTRAQIDTAVSWQRRFPNAKVIFSTGDTQGLGLPDAIIMAAYARRLGIPDKAILLESRSRNTWENLHYSRQMIAEHDLRQPALVLYDLHARRVLAIARRMGWQDLYWLTSYSRGDAAHGLKSLRTFSRPAILLYELFGMIYSRWQGWL